MKDLTITPMSPADLDAVMDWAAQEGWNPGGHDALTFRVADPAGFLMARLAGEPVVSISAVRYGQDFGFMAYHLRRDELQYQWVTFDSLTWFSWQRKLTHLAD